MACTADSDHGTASLSAPSQRVSVCAPRCTASESAAAPAMISSCASESSTVSCRVGAGGSGSQYALLSPTFPTVMCAVPADAGTTIAAVYVHDGAESDSVPAAAAAFAAASRP